MQIFKQVEKEIGEIDNLQKTNMAVAGSASMNI